MYTDKTGASRLEERIDFSMVIKRISHYTNIELFSLTCLFN